MAGGEFTYGSEERLNPTLRQPADHPRAARANLLGPTHGELLRSADVAGRTTAPGLVIDLLDYLVASLTRSGAVQGWEVVSMRPPT